ncbi:myosin light chain kinase 2, skeletal/cardiac muscle isoform X1 [Electrophorus electricus]|uniref:myosin light chain kinase 2, skeletal/cardiac muscle isoform X1 n=1 Tax=Electrophorus electricus TaxID=8005 RepID=UPI0015CFF8B5|nr:myosin light chain kinase 2, skeletal/cardiac muscle isoform X1 [Electrophorus electricus]
MTSVETGHGIGLIQVRIESLSSKMDALISIQEKVLSRLDSMSEELDGIEKDVETLKVDKEEIPSPPSGRVGGLARSVGGEMKEVLRDLNSIMTAVNERSEKQVQKLEGMERLVLSIQQVVGFIRESVKTSRITELLFRRPAVRKNRAGLKGRWPARRQAQGDALLAKPKDQKGKVGKEKSRFKGLKVPKKNKPSDATDAASLRKQALLLEEVQKLNRENDERSTAPPAPETETPLSEDLLNFILEEAKAPVAEPEEFLEEEEEEENVEKEPEHVEEPKKEEKVEGVTVEDTQERPEETDVERGKEMAQRPGEGGKEEVSAAVTGVEAEDPVTLQSREPEQADEMTACSKYRGMEGEEHKNRRAKDGGDKAPDRCDRPRDLRGVFKADGVEINLDFSNKKKQEEERAKENELEQFFIDCTPPPPAPFSHRVVSAKPNQISNFYTINRQEVLGGGRFGQVHKCVENSSGLTLAAKIIKARTQKEKDVVKNEIQVMNQLDHANLIQLYAAYESRADIILVLEYVDGGELFDRIIDENYKLTELDTVMFIRQICEGLRHMHKMYILHLDLKPENILCVSRLTNKIKIIDFGLARKYKPREKLRVNFGTPEFLAPEVVTYEFVSFNTDMWSLGVIAYMLLSGLSPFLGDDDNETLNNILACQWSFEESEFLGISEEARDFISKLLIVNKSWRIGASEALKHPWLSDPVLHQRLREQRNMCRSRRNSCVPPPEI